MSTETSYNFHVTTAYRRVENMAPTNSGALAKRAGTKLVLTDTREIRVFSTSEALYLFYSDDKYTVLNISDFSVLKAETPNPTDMEFVDIKKSTIQVIALPTGEKRILIPTTKGIFSADVAYVFSEVTVTGLPANTPTMLFIALPAKGLIANGNTLYFSAFNNIYDFTQFTDPSTIEAPTQGYQISYSVGLDGDIIDIIYYKNNIIIGTTEAIYRVEYLQLNPFADAVAKTTSLQRIEKIYNVGIEFKTFTDIGDFVIFANERGIYGIEVGGASSSAFDQYRIYTTELSYANEHITAEDGQSITAICAYYARENVFFALRNDGVIFKCAVSRDGDKRTPLFTRYVAGISMDDRRTYISLDHVGRAFVTQWNGRYFVEFHRMFPYLNDNKLVFSWHDTLETLGQFGFLDCFQNTSELKLIKARSNNPTHIIKVPLNSLAVGERYYYWDVIGEKYDIFQVASVRKQLVTITKTVQEIVILGKVKTESDLNVLPLTAIAGSSDLYVTYADMNFFPFRMHTVRYSADIKLSSFFLLAGFGYNGSAELAVVHKTPEETHKTDIVHPLMLSYFACECMEMTAFTIEGANRKNKVRTIFRHMIDAVEMPAVERKYLNYIIVAIPAGFSGELIEINFI